MYALVETGGKQYRVSIGDKLKVEKLEADEGATISLDRVLMVCDEGKVEVGDPVLEGTAVGATVLAQGRGEKIKVFKFKRRKKYRKTQGHRQSYTQLEITSIGDAKAEPKKEKAKKADKAEKAPKAEKAAKAKKAEKAPKAEKAAKAEKAPKAETAAKVKKADKAEKAAKETKSDKAED